LTFFLIIKRMWRRFCYYGLLSGVFGLPKARSYVDNGDGTISDLVTGLMWEKDMGDAVTWAEGMAGAENAMTGGYTDWRMPTMKELFSLILYSGQALGEDHVRFFIDDQYFDHPLGEDREIDAQTWSSSSYDGTVMNNNLDVTFGVNFVDGRVKAYPQIQGKYARYVRGSVNYGTNDFRNNNDGTISDFATGLMWSESDSSSDFDWEGALAYAESMSFAGYTDWRLPTIKELNSIVDYSKSQGEPALNESVFQITRIKDTEGEDWYPYFWSSTTLRDGNIPGRGGVYQTFGRALAVAGWMGELMDAHGAGAVRSDPKSGDRNDYPKHETGFQGDLQYVYNYVRLVRDIDLPNDERLSYPIVETDTSACYNDLIEISYCPSSGEPFYGQDGNWRPEDLEENDIAVIEDRNDSVEESLSSGATSGATSGARTDSGMVTFGIVALVLVVLVLLVIIGKCCCLMPNKNSDEPVRRAENIPMMQDSTQELNQPGQIPIQPYSQQFNQPGQIPIQPYSQQFAVNQRTPVFTEQVTQPGPPQWPYQPQPMPFRERTGLPPRQYFQPGAYTQYTTLPQEGQYFHHNTHHI